MKKTMLTCKTLDRFEAEYNTTQYTPMDRKRHFQGVFKSPRY